MSEQHQHENTAQKPLRIQRMLAQLSSAAPQTLYLRDGELILYRRQRSLLYQCRFKLPDGKWHRQSTGRASVEQAVVAACDIYDEARYRLKLGLAHRTHSYAHIAQLCVAELRQQIDLRGKKTAVNDYVSVIERYFIPYFAERQLESLTHTDVREFEVWRDRQLRRSPKTSTLNNFSSAWNRVIACAVERGYISERVPVPKLTSKGVKGTTRPAFTEEEVAQMLAYMDAWQHKGR
ncbi:MAG: integrase, partial [Betaproteobacteria bacterium]